MLKGLAIISLAVVVLLLLTATPIAASLDPAPTSSSPHAVAFAAPPTSVAPAPTAPTARPVPPPPSSGNATSSLTVGNLSLARILPWAFWGVNVEAQQAFGTSDANMIAATPINFLRFPGGHLGEWFNYTSAKITEDNGTVIPAGATTAQFVNACQLIHCHAIMQLPLEIDQPQTAAYYASYVVNTLHFQPAYWELGNSPANWDHFKTPWSRWGSQGGGNITPLPFAQLVNTYLSAIKAVDPAGHFLALGAWIGPPKYDHSWITELATVDGHNLSGISVHSYIAGGPGPSNPTVNELLGNLNGKMSLPIQVSDARADIRAACASCSLRLFVTEINAAEDSTYNSLLTGFAGPLYLAAETAQGLNLRITSMDWFCYDCNFTGAWETHPGRWQEQYTLFSQMMTRLYSQTLPTTFTGPNTTYVAATYGLLGLSLLLVNTNTTKGDTVDMTNGGILPGALVERSRWLNGTTGPTNSTLLMGNSVWLPPLSVTILTVGLSGIGLGPKAATPSSSHRVAAGAAPTPAPAWAPSHVASPPPPAPAPNHPADPVGWSGSGATAHYASPIRMRAAE